jgi:hypothetical protein
MIKRPLHYRFSDAVLEERKITTIREKPWPGGTPIILYNWEGKAYRSKHSDVAVIEMVELSLVRIQHHPEGLVDYSHAIRLPRELWSCEGFESEDEMDAWFRKVVKPGSVECRWLMRFRLIKKLSNPNTDTITS